MKLTQFTLGSAGPRIESIKTFTKTESDVLIIDLDLQFIPIDYDDLSAKQKRMGNHRNVLIELTAKLGLGPASVPIKVLLKELELSGIVI